jgi:hypothetical protein
MGIKMQQAFETLNRVANKVSGDHTKKSMALQLILVFLVVRVCNLMPRTFSHLLIQNSIQVLRIIYAVWAVLHLSFTSLMWSLIVLSVLFLGLTATRNMSRFLLLVVRCVPLFDTYPRTHAITVHSGHVRRDGPHRLGSVLGPTRRRAHPVGGPSGDHRRRHFSSVRGTVHPLPTLSSSSYPVALPARLRGTCSIFFSSKPS